MKDKPNLKYEDLSTIDVPDGTEVIRLTRYRWTDNDDPSRTGIKAKAQRCFLGGKNGVIRKEFLKLPDDADVLKAFGKAVIDLSKVAGK